MGNEKYLQPFESPEAEIITWEEYEERFNDEGTFNRIIDYLRDFFGMDTRVYDLKELGTEKVKLTNKEQVYRNLEAITRLLQLQIIQETREEVADEIERIDALQSAIEEAQMIPGVVERPREIQQLAKRRQELLESPFNKADITQFFRNYNLNRITVFYNAAYTNQQILDFVTQKLRAKKVQIQWTKQKLLLQANAAKGEIDTIREKNDELKEYLSKANMPKPPYYDELKIAADYPGTQLAKFKQDRDTFREGFKDQPEGSGFHRLGLDEMTSGWKVGSDEIAGIAEFFDKIPFEALSGPLIDFATDCGISMPILKTIGSSIKVANGIRVTYNLNKNKNKIIESYNVNDPSCLDKVLCGCISKSYEVLRNREAVKTASYGLDLALSFVDPTPISGLATASARLAYQIKVLFEAWLTIREINSIIIPEDDDANPLSKDPNAKADPGSITMDHLQEIPILAMWVMKELSESSFLENLRPGDFFRQTDITPYQQYLWQNRQRLSRIAGSDEFTTKLSNTIYADILSLSEDLQDRFPFYIHVEEPPKPAPSESGDKAGKPTKYKSIDGRGGFEEADI